MKNPRLFTVLRQTAEADKQKALMTLELLSQHPAGIGDHSTGDFYKNAEEALSMLGDANDRLETLDKYFGHLGLGDGQTIEAGNGQLTGQTGAAIPHAPGAIPGVAANTSAQVAR